MPLKVLIPVTCKVLDNSNAVGSVCVAVRVDRSKLNSVPDNERPPFVAAVYVVFVSDADISLPAEMLTFVPAV